MQVPLLNILIRTHNRESLFTRCLASIITQNYPNLRVIVSTDCGDTYVPDWCELIHVKPGGEMYPYDVYCNYLKNLVTDGWYFYLDDDDTLAPNCLSQLRLDKPAILVQLDYMGNTLPKSKDFTFGLIGMPCLILHHTLKNMVDFDGGDHGDSRYITEIAKRVDLDFQEVVVVRVDRKGHGR